MGDYIIQTRVRTPTDFSYFKRLVQVKTVSKPIR